MDRRFRRNGGLVVFFRFSELSGKWPLFANSANAGAPEFWRVRRAAPIPYSDHELFGVLRWKGVIEEVLNRRSVPKTLARIASRPCAFDGSLQALETRVCPAK